MASIFGDMGSAIVIIFIFSLLHTLLAASIGISNIKNNWEYYKCNPAIIPFAEVFGHDVGKNFNECVKKTQVDYMKVFLQPIYASLNYFVENGKTLTNSFEQLKYLGNIQGESSQSFVDDAKYRLYNISDSANRIFIGISDTFNKLTSSMMVLYYVVQSTILAGKSAWNELPGTFIKIGTFGAIS